MWCLRILFATFEINPYCYIWCSLTDNAGLCGIPGLPTCGPHLSPGAKVGIAFGASVACLLIVICSMCWWKRRQNILRAQQIAGTYHKPVGQLENSMICPP
ncbi:hypothetical protein HS088_TW21G01263 [Tripterygium wilfordii]|uniref:Uncharacterized protein n=1 Tax=Tripterygium wilfordii TaxID=458696 RepID=A0A7J7C5Q4_TRIWF|nr:hypothetical protein HS088_TW21G01263 [Tripterygium wilfordii]